MALIRVDDDELPLQRAYRWERERADEVFLTQPMSGSEVRDYTWAQAMDEARRLAAWLRAQGWEPGSRVAVMSKNTAWWIISDLAIWMAGHVSVPVYPNLVAETVRGILEHSGSRLVIVGKLDDHRSMMAGVPEGLPTVGTPLCDAATTHRWDELIASQAPLADSPRPAAQQMATIIYTSGTTGVPKGAVHTFEAFACSAKAVSRLINSTPNERALSYLPLAHVAERCLIEAHGLRVGFRIYFCRSLTTFQADLQRARPTFFFSVPRMWVMFQQGVLGKVDPKRLRWMLALPVVRRIVGRKVLGQLGLEHVRFAGTGAAPLPPEVMAWYRSLGLELIEGYGMTEQFAFATSGRPGRTRVGYVGEPTECCEVRLSGEGEILTRGPAHMQGYFLEPQKTADTLTADGWLRTGDLGHFDRQGRLRIVGRAKEQFKTSKGKYVSPAPIECRLASFARLEACMVCGVAFPQPFALAMLASGAWQRLQDEAARKAFSDELSAHLRQVNQQLDPHERLDFIALVPDQWTVENGFITPTLKLKRNNLEKHYGPHFEAWAARRKPIVWHEAV